MKQYKIFLISSLILSAYFLASILLSSNENFEISVHDTYFIICKMHIWAAMIVFLLVINLAYFILSRTNRKIKNLLFIIHFVFTFLPLVAMYILYAALFPVNQELSFSLTCMLFGMLIAGQLVLFLNIVLSKKTA